MNPYVVLALAVALNGCATSAQVGAGDDFGTIAVDTIRAHARAVRDHVRADRAAFRAAFGLERRTDSRAQGNVIDRWTGEPPIVAREAEPAGDGVPDADPASARRGRGHPARDAVAHPIHMEVQPSEMLTQQGALQPSAARSLARMDRMAREHGGEFTVTVPRAYIESAAAIRAAAPGATILSAERSDSFRLVVVPVED